MKKEQIHSPQNTTNYSYIDGSSLRKREYSSDLTDTSDREVVVIFNEEDVLINAVQALLSTGRAEISAPGLVQDKWDLNGHDHEGYYDDSTNVFEIGLIHLILELNEDGSLKPFSYNVKK